MRRRATFDGPGEVPDDIRGAKSYGLNTVAVPADVLGNRVVRGERAGDDHANRPVLEGIGYAIVHAGFGAAVGHNVEAERRTVEMGRLLCIADVKLNVVEIRHGQRRALVPGCFFGCGHRMITPWRAGKKTHI
jgi:hypothetical protein